MADFVFVHAGCGTSDQYLTAALGSNPAYANSLIRVRLSALCLIDENIASDLPQADHIGLSLLLDGKVNVRIGRRLLCLFLGYLTNSIVRKRSQEESRVETNA